MRPRGESRHPPGWQGYRECSDMWLYHTSVAVMRVLQWIPYYWRVRLTGAVETIPRKGPLLVVSNHASFLDPWFIMQVFPRNIRYLITKNWYYKSGLWQAFFRGYGTEPVIAGDPRGTIDAISGLLGAGETVGIFPEGRISADGRIRRFKAGIVRVAARSGAPVIPIGVRGSFESLPRQRRFPRKVRVTIHVGEPLVFPGSPRDVDPAPDEIWEFRDRIVRAVCALAGQEERIESLTRRFASGGEDVDTGM